MTLDTQMTLALLQELLMALRANDADGLTAGGEPLARLGDRSAETNTCLGNASLIYKGNDERSISLGSSHEGAFHSYCGGNSINNFFLSKIL